MQFCLITILSHGFLSSYQMASTRNPAGPYVQQDGAGDLDFARRASISGQFVQQRKLRASAQESPLEGIAKCTLRRLWARDTSFDCTDVKASGLRDFQKLVSRESAPTWRGQVAAPDISETGVVVGPQSLTTRVAR